jgi:dephospho-CoA kinase
MLIVGLTGGVASGKTAIAEAFKEEGAYLINADQIARELVDSRAPAWKDLITLFGNEILEKDGSLDRKKLGARVFSDPQQRNLLNQTLHPRIMEEIDRRVKEIVQKDPDAIIVIDAALLIEIEAYRKMDKVIVVAATEKQQMERLRERDGLNQEGAQAILSSQMATEEKLKVADYIIHNEGFLEEAKKRAKEIFQELKGIALQKNKDR